MISLNNIYENIIAEVVVFLLSFLLSKFLLGLFKRDEIVVNNKKFDALRLAIFLASVSILNLILNISFWNKSELTTLFTLLSIVFVVSATYIYNNQCPACKRFIRAKKKIDEKIIKEFNKEIPYQPMKVWKYTNGRIKRKEPFGDRKIRIEKWQTKQEFYECNYCKYQWDSGQVDIPLVIEKEFHTIININEIDPNEPDLY